MRSCLARLALLPLALLPAAHAQSAQAVAQSARIQAQISSQSPVTLAHHVPDYALPANNLPSVPLAPSTHLDGVILLSRAPQVEAAFDQLLQDQLNPASPSFHHWLTPQQVGSLYGPAQSDVDAVTAWLSAQGLTVLSVSPSRTQIAFTGSAQTLSSAFATSFRTFALANGESRFSLTQDPSVPAALAPVVSSIAGLSKVIHHPFAQHKAVAAKPNSASGDKPQFTDTDSSGTQYFLLDSDFDIAFDINTPINAGYNGTGQNIAVAGLSRVNPTDVTTTETIAGQTARSFNTIIPPNGQDPGPAQTTYSASNQDNGDQDEATIDLDRSAGTATGATLDLVVSADIGAADTYATQGLFIAINYEINTLNDPILNISFGGCEALNGQANTVYESSLFQQAASEGITTFVSSDDSGAAGCNYNYNTIPTTQQLSINDLCASPYVTCVGGTEFADTASPTSYWSSTNSSTNNSSILGYIPEGAWNEVTAPSASTGTTYSYGATGGGLSDYISKPSWQTGTGVLAGNFREVPDVAFPSALHDGFVACLAYLNASCQTGSYFEVFGGTSVAAPSMAGVQALINQRLGGRQGNINPTIYSLAASTPSAFHDATVASSAVSGCALTTPSMCNNSTPSPTSLTGGLQGYALTTGWDAATGWGSLDVNNFITAYAASVSSSLQPTTIAFTSTPSSVTQNASASFVVTVSGLTAGTTTGANVVFTDTTSNTTLGSIPLTDAGTSGTATLSVSFASTGTHVITAVFTGDSHYYASNTASTSITVNAAGKTATSIAFTNPPTSVVETVSTSFTATVSGLVSGTSTNATVTFTDASTNTVLGMVALTDSGTSGTASVSASFAVAEAHTITAVFNGDTNYAASNLASTTITVNAAPTFTLAPNPASLTLASASGASGSSIITATSTTSTNPFTGTISFGCAVALTSGASAAIPPTCSFSSTTGITLPAATSITVTLGTVAPTTSLRHSTARAALTAGGTLTFAGLLLLLPYTRRRGNWKALAAILFLAGSLVGLGGCGSSSSSSGTTTSGGTTTGAYTVAIIGTSTAAGNPTASTTIALTVN